MRILVQHFIAFIVIGSFLLLFIQFGLSRKQLVRFRSKSALITGGAGFVGRRFTKTLCDSGWHVTIVDNMMSESALSLQNWPRHLKCPSSTITFLQQDCRLYFATQHEHFELFIHLAAVVGGRATIENAPLHVADDLSIDAAAFQWAVDSRSRPGNMIYFSSSAAYPVKMQGLGSSMILSENLIDLNDDYRDISKPDLSYGWAKLTGEYLALLAVQKYKLKVSVYRPMSGYGEDQHESYPFKAILKRVMKQENPLKIWSNATRDFFYIQDVVDCVLETMQLTTDANPTNLATSEATSMDALARKMTRQVASRYSPTIVLMENKPQGVNYRVGSSSRLHALGCKHKVDLDQGITIALAFERNLL